MEEWITLISNVGFPIVAALYLMTKMENTIKKNTEVIAQLSEKIGAMNNAK